MIPNWQIASHHISFLKKSFISAAVSIILPLRSILDAGYYTLSNLTRILKLFHEPCVFLDPGDPCKSKSHIVAIKIWWTVIVGRDIPNVAFSAPMPITSKSNETLSFETRWTTVWVVDSRDTGFVGLHQSMFVAQNPTNRLHRRPILWHASSTRWEKRREGKWSRGEMNATLYLEGSKSLSGDTEPDPVPGTISRIVSEIVVFGRPCELALTYLNQLEASLTDLPLLGAVSRGGSRCNVHRKLQHCLPPQRPIKRPFY